MDDTRTRLSRCFAAVFPDVPAGDLENATATDVAAWDSIAHVTLLAVVEEEFGVAVPADEIESLTSFPAFLDFLAIRA